MKRMNKIAAILMVSVIAMAVLIPAATAGEIEYLKVKSLTGVKDESGSPLEAPSTTAPCPCTPPGEGGGDTIQVIRVHGTIDPPDPSDPNWVGGDDEFLQLSCIPEGFPFECESGKFLHTIGNTLYNSEVIICRAWNAATIDDATYYGDSETYTIPASGTGPFEHDYGTWWTNDTKPTASKNVPMKAGWNAVSLCYEPSINTPADVLSSIWANVSAVKEWDAVSKTWAEATTMDRDGTGYFVYVTQDCTWEHTGTKKTAPVTIPLEQGLNLVGYPFGKTNSTGDALAGLNYNYAAPFDASTQKYEDTYNPAAPAPFNDFTTISPCEGFWISSKDGGDWTAA